MFEKIDDTLFILKDNVYICIKNNHINVKQKENILTSLSLFNISKIVINSYCSMSSEFIKKCSKLNINIYIVDKYNNIVSSLNNFNLSNFKLKQNQFMKTMNKQYSLQVAKNIVIGKINNSYSMLYTCSNNIKNTEISKLILTNIKRLKSSIQLIENSKTIDQLRGYEGEAARLYFSILPYSFYKHKKYFPFEKRTYNPPENILNCLLSFCYSLLLKECIHACCLCDLDPSMGFMHTNATGKPSLALDLMEEFRSIIADRLAVSVINLNIIKKDDFYDNMLLKKEAKKRILIAYHNRKNKKIQYKTRKIKNENLFYLRAKEIAKCIQNDTCYNPYRYGVE